MLNKLNIYAYCLLFSFSVYSYAAIDNYLPNSSSKLSTTEDPKNLSSDSELSFTTEDLSSKIFAIHDPLHPNWLPKSKLGLLRLNDAGRASLSISGLSGFSNRQDFNWGVVEGNLILTPDPVEIFVNIGYGTIESMFGKDTEEELLLLLSEGKIADSQFQVNIKTVLTFELTERVNEKLKIKNNREVTYQLVLPSDVTLNSVSNVSEFDTESIEMIDIIQSEKYLNANNILGNWVLYIKYALPVYASQGNDRIFNSADVLKFAENSKVVGELGGKSYDWSIDDGILTLKGSEYQYYINAFFAKGNQYLAHTTVFSDDEMVEEYTHLISKFDETASSFTDTLVTELPIVINSDINSEHAINWSEGKRIFESDSCCYSYQFSSNGDVLFGINNRLDSPISKAKFVFPEDVSSYEIFNNNIRIRQNLNSDVAYNIRNWLPISVDEFGRTYVFEYAVRFDSTQVENDSKTGSGYIVEPRINVLSKIDLSSFEQEYANSKLPDPDTDKDGIPDAIDPDDDNDGVLDGDDAFPLDPEESLDTDGDGIGNNADIDDDGDGVIDTLDEYPLDSSRHNSNPDEDPSGGSWFGVKSFVVLDGITETININAPEDDSEFTLNKSYNCPELSGCVGAADILGPMFIDFSVYGNKYTGDIKLKAAGSSLTSTRIEGVIGGQIVFDDSEIAPDSVSIDYVFRVEGEYNLPPGTSPDPDRLFSGSTIFYAQAVSLESGEELVFPIHWDTGLYQDIATDGYRVVSGSILLPKGHELTVAAGITFLAKGDGDSGYSVDFSDNTTLSLSMPKVPGLVLLDGFLSETSPFTEETQNIDKDVNGDGMADVLWRNQSDGRNWMWTMDGRSILRSAGINRISDQAWQIAGRGDFNDDGKSDIIWRNSDTGRNWVYLMDGFAIASSQQLNYVTDTNWQIKGVGDFDGDGKDDVIWRHAVRGDTWVYLMNGTSIRVSQGSRKVADLNWEIVAVGDVNGDSKDDVIWRHATRGDNYIWLMNGVQLSSGYVLNRISTNWEITGSGDLNGDGTDDIIWRNKVDGRNWGYLMNGGQIQTSQLINTVSSQDWQMADILDLDGDGKVDIFWRNSRDGRSYIFLMNGLSITSQGFSTSVSNNWKAID